MQRRTIIRSKNSTSTSKTEGTTRTFGQSQGSSTTKVSLSDAVPPAPTAGQVVAAQNTPQPPPSEVTTPGEVKKLQKEFEKIDLLISVRSKPSYELEFNNLDIPETNLKFKYNFYEKNESEATVQEDYSLDPLLTKKIFDVPRYVEIRWDQASLLEKLNIQKNLTPEEKMMRDRLFSQQRGYSDAFNLEGTNTFSTYEKDQNLITREGKRGKIVDVHKTDEAFDNIANEKRYRGSSKSSVNIEDNIERGEVSLEEVLAKSSKGGRRNGQ